jgi:hypothetical protein
MPAETIDAWKAASPPLDPRRLLPALMRIAEEAGPVPSKLQEEALRYVEHCISKLDSSDPAVHNLAVVAPAVCCTSLAPMSPLSLSLASMPASGPMKGGCIDTGDAVLPRQGRGQAAAVPTERKGLLGKALVRAPVCTARGAPAWEAQCLRAAAV